MEENTNENNSPRQKEISAPKEPEVVTTPQTITPTSAVPSQLQRHHSEFSVLQDEYIRNYIELADTKASLIFTSSVGIIGYLFGNDQIRERLLSPSLSINFFAPLLTTLCCMVLATLAFLVIVPRLSARSNERIVFFGAVAQRKSAEEYVSEIEPLTEEKITENRLKHCYDIAYICNRKYNLLRKSIILVPISFFLLLSTLLSEKRNDYAWEMSFQSSHISLAYSSRPR